MKIEKILLIVGSLLTVFFSSCGSSSPLDESKIIAESQKLNQYLDNVFDE